MMRESSFFQTTRGRIVESLKRHRARTAVELSHEQGVTPNAIRQHLARLERDGLVAERAKRLGRTKPTFVYSLTEEGERLFPQRYPLLLNVLLDELQREDPARLKELFSKIGRRSAQRHAARFAGKDIAGRVAELAKFLRERGVVVEYEKTPTGFAFREFNCPFKDTVTTHPEICSMVHSLMEEVLPEKPHQVTSIARGDDSCEFELAASHSTPARPATAVPAMTGDV